MVSTTNKQRAIYLLWASMDAFYIILYILRNIARGAIPFLSDLNSGLDVVRSWGGSGIVIWVGLFLQFSVIVTCVGFSGVKNSWCFWRWCRCHSDFFSSFRQFRWFCSCLWSLLASITGYGLGCCLLQKRLRGGVSGGFGVTLGRAWWKDSVATARPWLPALWFDGISLLARLPPRIPSLMRQG